MFFLFFCFVIGGWLLVNGFLRRVLPDLFGAGQAIQLFCEQPLERLIILVIDWNGKHDNASLLDNILKL